MSLLHLKIEPTLNASTRKVIIIWYIPKIGYFYMQFSDLSLWWMNGRKLGSIYNLLEKITSIERIIGLGRHLFCRYICTHKNCAGGVWCVFQCGYFCL